MIVQEKLTPAQQHLWMRAQEEMVSHCYNNVLFLTNALLRSAPEFLEARKLARQAAMAVSERTQKNFFTTAQLASQRLFLRVRVAILVQKKQYSRAILVLENFLAIKPCDLTANRLMATVAVSWNQALLPLALFALETAVINHENLIPLHLDIAKVSLLCHQNGFSKTLERSITAYQEVLHIDPYHLEARQGLKNASALLSMHDDSWKISLTYQGARGSATICP
jgi:tetratricopeptide (TPR) repeat protein